MGWRIKYSFTNTCFVRLSKVYHTPTGCDRKNTLISVGLSFWVTVHGGERLEVIW